MITGEQASGGYSSLTRRNPHRQRSRSKRVSPFRHQHVPLSEGLSEFLAAYRQIDGAPLS